MSTMNTEAQTVSVKPIVMSRIGYGSAAFVFVVFVVTALLQKSHNAGAHFGDSDQIGTVVIGVVLAGLCLMATRPRLVAGADGVRMRSFLGGWRVVPWDVVLRVEFPSKVRFARLVLPGEETLALYAVQRLDKQQAIDTMRRLRALHAQAHPEFDATE
jgi:Bacterial PH domain